MIGEWKHLDESERLILPQHRNIGNYFKSHICSFFKEEKELLNFCLLEITTLLNATAIGEIFVYSNVGDWWARKKVECYRKIVTETEAEFNKNITEYLDWYKKRTYIYIGHNPSSTFVRGFRGDYGWRLDNEKHKTEENFSLLLADTLEDSFIMEYLNHYIEKLENELNLSDYKHFAVIIKPLSLKHDGEIIPLGNLYLHFGTEIPYNFDEYLDFINQFISVYLKEKGGKIIKEVELKSSKLNSDIPSWQPYFSPSALSQTGGKELLEHLTDLFNEPRVNFEKLYHETAKQLNNELIECFLSNGSLSKELVTKARVLKFPLIKELLKQKSITVKSVSEKCTDDSNYALYYLLFRQLVFIMLLSLNLSPADIHKFIYDGELEEGYHVSSKAVYYFFLSKFSLSIKERLIENPITSGIDRNAIFNQASKFESILLDTFKPATKEKYTYK